jgi:hypothetical protein
MNKNIIYDHVSFDYGTLAALDAAIGTKTKTTLCGQVVPIQLINNVHPTCPQCRYELDEAKAFMNQLESK